MRKKSFLYPQKNPKIKAPQKNGKGGGGPLPKGEEERFVENVLTGVLTVENRTLPPVGKLGRNFARSIRTSELVGHPF